MTSLSVYKGEGVISPVGLACSPGQEQRPKGRRSVCQVAKGISMTSMTLAVSMMIQKLLPKIKRDCQHSGDIMTFDRTFVFYL